MLAILGVFLLSEKRGIFNLFERRFYMPELGPFLTPDPAGLEAGPNLYAYANGNPLIHCDHYGDVKRATNREPGTFSPQFGVLPGILLTGLSKYESWTSETGFYLKTVSHHIIPVLL